MEKDAPPPGHAHVPPPDMLTKPLLSRRLTFSKSGRSVLASRRAMGTAVCLSARQSMLARTVRAAVLMSQSSSCSRCVTSGSRPCRVAAYVKHTISFCDAIEDCTSKTTLRVEGAALVGQRALPLQRSPGPGLKRSEAAEQGSRGSGRRSRRCRFLAKPEQAAARTTACSLAPGGHPHCARLPLLTFSGLPDIATRLATAILRSTKLSLCRWSWSTCRTWPSTCSKLVQSRS